jgi:Papain-like cysteine protease AvrRpt2
MKMPYVHDIRTRIRGRRASLCFWKERAGRFPIPRVHQLDEHSCGFLAALVVAQYFDPSVTVRDVLEAVPRGWQPSPQWGLSGHKLARTLAKFGIECPNREGLGWRKLLKLTTEGHPVIVTVHPDGWLCDHWTVVRGLKDRSRKILLSNPAPKGYEYDGLAKDGSMSWSDFNGIWSPRGAGLVCTRM